MVNSGNDIPNRFAGDEGFKDKTLLITGGTGFIGKVLIEKVLRTCHLVRKIYVLIRTKKGKDPQDRLKEMFNSPLFDLLKTTIGESILNKVIAIEGDVAEPNLGLSKTDHQKLTEEVEIVFHLAATVRFDEPLKKSVLINTRGTKLMIDLAKQCRDLLVFCHVSTAYCYLHERVLYERTYSVPADPDTVIGTIEWLEEEVVENVSKHILGSIPNTYTFTKALAEKLVEKEMTNHPFIIFRPSVVIPIWSDPLPGWTDNLNGPVGIMIAGAKGILRTLYCDPNIYADFLPVDVAANGLMMVAYDYMVHRERKVYNCTTSFKFKVTWGEILELGRNIIMSDMPLNGAVWYPCDGSAITTSRWLHNIRMVLYHYIPAIILDFLIFLSGNKPFLWKIQKRLTKGFEVLEYYANNQWDFNCENLLKARELMNETEKELYELNEENFKPYDYIYNCIHGSRLYILKESDESLPAARRHMKRMWYLDKFCKSFVVIGVFYLLVQLVVTYILM